MLVTHLTVTAGVGVQTIRPHGPGEKLSFREISGPMLERFFKVNAVAPHLLTVDLVGGMIERGWGRIVNISTSLDTMLKQVAYGASKAANEAYAALMAVKSRPTMTPPLKSLSALIWLANMRI